MTWFRVDDSMPSHPKTRSIPRKSRMAALGVWTACGTWSAKHLTDGRVPADVVEDEGGLAADGQRLVTAGLWHAPGHKCERCPQPAAGEYQFHDWADYQPTRIQVLAERAASAERQRVAREKRAKSRRDGVRDDGRDSDRDEHSDNAVSSAAPTRPDPTPSTSTHQTSSSDLPERDPKTDDDGPTIDELTERGAGRLDPAALRTEAEAFRHHNAGRWANVHDWRRAWSGWLTKAQQRNRPTPTPSTPSCPIHPDQPTGSKACPRCAAEAAPVPAGQLRAAVRREAS